MTHQQIDNHTQTFDIDEPVRESFFNETEPITKGRSPEPTQGKKKAFTHSSRWIGNVRYNPQNQTMRVMMNNKGYGFCGVPEKVYDSWEGSPSKGEYWWRNIKDRYDCGSLKEATNNADDMDWPPEKTGGMDQVDCLMINYSPDTGRPDGITPDEKEVKTEPFPTGQPYTYPDVKETQTACGNCRFYVDGGSCALVKGAIDPVHGICKFYEGGQPLAYNTQVFPIYEQVEAEYKVMPYEPYLRESVVNNIIDREHDLIADGIPENEVHDILRKEFGDTSIVETFDENKHPRDKDGKFTSGGNGNDKILSPSDHWDSLDTGEKFNLMSRIGYGDLAGPYLNKSFDELPPSFTDKLIPKIQYDQVLVTDSFEDKGDLSDSLEYSDISKEIKQIQDEFQQLEEIADATANHPTIKIETKLDREGFKIRDFLHSTFSNYDIAPFGDNPEQTKALWEELGKKNPEVKKGFDTLNKRVDAFNDKSIKTFETSESFYRGTSTHELDTYLQTGSTNVADDPYNLKYNFTAVAPHKEMAEIYDAGVTVEYDGDDVRKTGHPVNYDLFWRDKGTRTETKENGKMDAIYMDQMEVRLDRNTSLNQLKIKNIYLSSDNAHLAEKYSRLGNVIVQQGDQENV